MGKNNNLNVLKNHLFESLERLNDDELMESNTKREIGRAKAIAITSREIIAVTNLALDIERIKLIHNHDFNGVDILDTKQGF